MKIRNLIPADKENNHGLFSAAAILTVLILALTLVGQTTARAATFTVTTTSDNVAGSLRQTIGAANATAADDTINFNLTGCPNNVCTLGLSGGELVVNSASTAGKLTIVNSTGAANLIVSGQNLSRAFYLRPGADLTLDGVTVANGNGTGATNSSADNVGGGIYLELFSGSPAKLTVKNSIVRDNAVLTASNNSSGSAIYNGNGMLIITNSTIRNNAANGTFGSGAIFSNTGTVSLTNSTVSSNTAQRHGGGIYCTSSCSATLINSTVSGNSAAMLGGGIFSNIGTIYLVNSTVTNNTAAQGGGVYQTSNPKLYLYNSIVAANAGTTGPPDIASFEVASDVKSCGNNLIGNTTNTGGTSITWQTTDILNQPPVISSLGNYGGATETHALLFNSPAVNTGKSGLSIVAGCSLVPAAPVTDQRGVARVGNVDIGAFEFTGGKTVFDFDGDGKTDVSVFRPSNGTWYLQRSTNGFAGAAFGATGDRLAPADYDGDGRTDIAVYRPSAGAWYILQSSNGAFRGVGFGAAEDLPRPGDFDGDDKADINVYRPSAGAWYRLNSSNNSFVGVAFGAAGDAPLIADFDGDAKSDIAVFRAGFWYYLQSSDGQFRGVQFGASTDVPTPADYDGDGKSDIAVFRASSGTWYRLNSSTGSFVGVAFGQSGDVPVAGDYDGDGKSDVAVFRQGAWYILRSSNNSFTGVSFGAPTDAPAPAAYLP